MLNQPGSEVPATGGRGLTCSNPDVGGLRLGISKTKRKSMSFFAKLLLLLYLYFFCCMSFLKNSVWGQQQFPQGHCALGKMGIQLPCRATAVF